MEIHEQIGGQMMKIRFLWHRLVQSMQMQAGLDQETIVNGRILGYLDRNRDKDVYQKDIEREACLTKSAVSNIITGMEKKGYVKRLSVESDARLKKIILTDAGTEALHKLIKAIQTGEQAFVNGMTEEEQETFVRLLAQVISNMKDMEASIKHD